jgi:hypothetical protein
MLSVVASYDAPEIEDFETFHNARFEAVKNRIQAVLNRRKAKPIRGIPRPIYRDDGAYYISVSEAARHNGTRPDYICQAIKTYKKCAGRSWAYADGIPDGFWDSYIALHGGEFSHWPYKYNPICR